MKTICIALSLLFAIAACKKDENSQKTLLLKEVTLSGKINQSFEYDENSQLLKENFFGLCTSNPQDEYEYTYENKKLTKVGSVMRSYFSSTLAMCDPLKGVKSEETFVYDEKGRISKVNRANSVTEYFYNQQGFIERAIITGGASSIVYRYEHDSRGNVIKETDPQGFVAEYEFDNKKNPLYYIKSRPGTPTPFNLSPNNVIKRKAGSNYVRKFEYNSEGYPSKVVEDNGETYVYIYE